MSRIEQPNDRSATLWIDFKRIGVSRSHRDQTVPGAPWAYHWQVTDVDADNGPLNEGRADLYGPATGVDPGPLAMLGTLLSFLGACGDAYEYSMRNPGTSENLTLFPESMREWCYQWSEEIGMARYEIDVRLNPEEYLEAAKAANARDDEFARRLEDELIEPTDDESHAEEERRRLGKLHLEAGDDD